MVVSVVPVSNRRCCYCVTTRIYRLRFVLVLYSFIIILIYQVRVADTSTNTAETTVDSTATTSKNRNGNAFRHDHLDYFDVDTLLYYIESTTTPAPQIKTSRTSTTNKSPPVSSLDYDVAILFYAQWSSHCHTLAPMWDQMSRILQAGTKDSKIIFGLFDCEETKQHEAICQNTLHIKKYPTVAFFSMAGNHHHLSLQAPRHVTKFEGNWQYGDAILDWIQALSAVSQWHRSKWGERIRNTLLFGRKKATHAEPLPIGIPHAISDSDSHKVKSLQKELNQTVSLAIRSNSMMQAMFLPEQETAYPVLYDYGKNYTDMYAMLQELGAWTTSTRTTSSTVSNYSVSDRIVLRTCVAELSMDYCNRISTQYIDLWIEQWPLDQKVTDEVFEQFQNQMVEYLNNTEPHCVHVQDECTISNFTKPICQPQTCPFGDRVACRFLTACLTKQIQLEYANALGILPTEQQPPPPPTKKKEKKTGGFSWGL